ncbi:MAG: PLP-dependent transferase [Actinobacteria bacterium]|nr:PLP-dependent transferase [Actinomycetota bacterium]
MALLREAAPGAGGRLTARSLDDLRDALDELVWLDDTLGDRLRAVYQEVVRAPMPEPVRRFQLRELTRFGASAVKLVRELAVLRRRARRPRVAPAEVDRLAEAVRVHAGRTRALRGAAAGVATASDWQSPSFGHSTTPAAGRMSGRVTEHRDDYKRDRHPDAAWFERAYLREYVDRSAELRLRALMTNCGMSAFTTVLAFLEERAGTGPVLVGRGVYHECVDLLRRSPLADRLEEVDEQDAAGIVGAVRERRASALVLDVLCNARGIAVPDVDAVLRGLEAVGDPLLVVLDTTGLSVAAQPFRVLRRVDGPLRPIAFESLTKYPQFGIDRTTAGMIVAPATEAALLDGIREHIGANVNDTSVYVLPEPNRAMLERRLARIGRNAEILASRLTREIDEGPRRVLQAVRCPGLPDHPGHAAVARLGFRGGFFQVAFRPEHDVEQLRRRFVGLALAAAGRRGAALVEGASFGFDTTRIYLTASGETTCDAFVRVAAGAEHLAAVAALADALCDAARGLELARWTSVSCCGRSAGARAP